MVELLAPSSSYKKTEVAFRYGADSIYLGMGDYSLRKRAGRVSFSELEKIIGLARSLNKKVFITANIIPHNSELKGVKKYFKKLKKIGVSGVILSSPYFIKVAKKCGLIVHLSTQQSITNSYAIDYFKKLGVKRIVLARELALSDIKSLKTDLELEVFIHGGACMSFSGRCILSNILTGRDSNSGDCAHSCRWVYYLYSNNKLVYNKPFSLSSKDLYTIDIIKEIIKIKNVAALKIEGRMKSANYLATIIRAYREVIDNENPNYEKLRKDLKSAGGRDLGLFNYNNLRDNMTQIYDFKPTSPQQAFLGVVIKQDNKRVYLRVKNKIYNGSKVYFFTPNGDSETFLISDLQNEDGKKIKSAPHPEEIISFKYDKKLEKGALLKDASI